MMEECPLFHQFLQVLNEEDRNKKAGEQLYDKLIVVDFGDIFMPANKAKDRVKKKKENQQQDVKDLMEQGLDIHFGGRDVHMVPFDKSGNMSRNGRITFIDESYLNIMNERLNLGIDFGQISVILSKYYAYRGLYLSSSRRVECEDFRITPETLVIVKDNRTYIDTKGKEKPITGRSYDYNILEETAKEKTPGSGYWVFEEPEQLGKKYVDVPYDGEGFITPHYSKYINQSLDIESATSFQVRLPFAKGMLHEVDVQGFLDEYSAGGLDEQEYWYEDAFGINRDLKKAQIFLTESMFKGKNWVKSFCDSMGIEDPMQYYCDMIEKFNHALYVSGTNLPYGFTKYTHLSYQTINTLDFTEEQFNKLTEKHCKFIQEPITYLQGMKEIEDQETTYYVPNWKKAVFENSDFVNDSYIKEQLENTKKGLLTKLATGKLVVEGQTRYLCRDLLPLLSSLMKSYYMDIKCFHPRYLWQSFYMPMGRDIEGKPKVELDYTKYYAFFRNPHLSRNEQCLLKPCVSCEKKDYVKRQNVTYEHHLAYVKMYQKYFGHLTGIVMISRGSIVPLCLGGADFDGDLVSVVFDEDVIEAVKSGTYSGYRWLKRKLSVIAIPSTTGKEESVPKYVPYNHIYNTFYNRIGQISNAAISIGQMEYSEKIESEYDPNKPTCAKCTLLTGLEIDAAKNGVHPNLDLILNDNIKKCSYISFLNSFKKLRAESKFRYGKLKVENVDNKHIRISATDCKTVAEFKVPEHGTYINKLPILFVENYEKLKKERHENSDFCGFEYDKAEVFQMVEEQIQEFQSKCSDILTLYFFYKEILLNVVKNEKNKRFYGDKNLEIFIDRIYDTEYAEYILLTIIPSLQEKIEIFLQASNSIKEIKDRINDLQWQMQPYEKRGEALEKIIGNGFRISCLTEEEKEFLCHFNQQGYKLLWILVDTIKESKKIEFDVIKGRVNPQKDMPMNGRFMSLDMQLEKDVRAYYENNATHIDMTLYVHCLKELQQVIEEYREIMDMSIIIPALYEITGVKGKKNQRKFFWDAFSWEDLQPLVSRKG